MGEKLRKMRKREGETLFLALNVNCLVLLSSIYSIFLFRLIGIFFPTEKENPPPKIKNK